MRTIRKDDRYPRNTPPLPLFYLRSLFLFPAFLQWAPHKNRIIWDVLPNMSILLKLRAGMEMQQNEFFRIKITEHWVLKSLIGQVFEAGPNFSVQVDIND